MLALSAPVDWLPEVDRFPDQPPEPAQLVAFVVVQVRIELEPLDSVVGLALRETLGAGADTETVTDCAALPPAPVQVSVYCVALVRLAVLWEPLMGSLPDQPPEAEHEVALAEVQVRVVALPLFTVLGLALSVTVGDGVVTETVAD